MAITQVARAARLLFAAVLLLAVTTPVSAAPSDSSRPDAAQSCVAILDRAPSGGADAIVVESKCFATFAEAFEYGSRGAVDVPADLQPTDVTQALAVQASASSSYLLGTYWDCLNYGGWFGCPNWSWWASGGCTPTSGWQVSYVGDSQNDRYESSKSYSGCNQNTHFEHANYGGASLVCRPNCSTLGVMNNATSSLRWFG